MWSLGSHADIAPNVLSMAAHLVESDVDEFAFETETVRTPALSPAHYWEAATTQSGMFRIPLVWS